MSIYERYGVAPIINASGTVTRLGGAPMPEAVLDAFREAAAEWVPLDQLQAAASKQIAQVTGTEAGLVTAGSAAALTVGAAAILTGLDPGRMERLPHCDGFPHEFVVAREHRSGYDHAVRAAGVKFVEVGFNEIISNAGVRRTEAWEYEAAFTESTAGVFYVHTPDPATPLREVLETAHRHNLPVLVDAAGELPPRSNLRDIAATGADLVAYSGGKSIRGPQSTGILCGKRDLIASAALQMLDMDDHFDLWDPPGDFLDKSLLAGIPRHGIARGMKVSKEEIIALLVALDLFASGAYDEERPAYFARLQTVTDALNGTTANCTVIESADGERPPVLEIAIDEDALGRSAFEVCRRLRNGSPPIYVSHGQRSAGKLVVHPLCLDDQATSTLASRLREELTA